MRWFRQVPDENTFTTQNGTKLVKVGTLDHIAERVAKLELAELNRKETEDPRIFKWGDYFLTYVRGERYTMFPEYTPAVPEHYTVRPPAGTEPILTIDVRDFSMYEGLIKFHEKRGR